MKYKLFDTTGTAWWLEFHLLDHFRVLKNPSNLFLIGFVGNRFNTGDGCAGSVPFIFQSTNNTGDTGKTDTTSTTAGAVQNGTTDIIEDRLVLKTDSAFL